MGLVVIWGRFAFLSVFILVMPLRLLFFSKLYLTSMVRKYLISKIAWNVFDKSQGPIWWIALNVYELVSLCFFLLNRISSNTKIERLILKVDIYRKAFTVYLLFWFSFYLGFKMILGLHRVNALLYVFLDFLQLFHEAIWNVLEVIWLTKRNWRRVFFKWQFTFGHHTTIYESLFRLKHLLLVYLSSSCGNILSIHILILNITEIGRNYLKAFLVLEA